MDINEITDTNTITTKNINVDEDKIKDFKQFFKEEPQAVNTNEFVKNGSIAETKVYFVNNNLVITKDDRKEGITNAVIIDAHTGGLTFKNYSNKTEKQKDVTSFISGGNLFSIGLSKEDMNLKSFDLLSGKEKSAYNISALSKNLKADFNQAAFLKEAAKGSMTPTVTVNKAGKNYAVRIDAVNKETYNYNYNWWWHHWMMQHQMMQQQRILQQNNVRMMNMRGPGHRYYDRMIADYKEKKDIAFTVLLNEDLQLIDEYEPKTDLADIDKDKYLNQYKNDKSVLQLTATFLDTELRCIYQDKISRDIVITNWPL